MPVAIEWLVGVNALVALLFTATVAALSLQDNAHAGPQFKQEVRQHYVTYTVLIMLRLVGYCFAIFFWLAGLGSLLYGSVLMLTGGAYHWLMQAGVTSLVVVLVMGFQFSLRLLLTPGVILACSPYDITRFIPWWRQLSVSGLRWVALLASLLLLGLVVMTFELFTVTSLAVIYAGLWLALLSPILLAYLPVSLPASVLSFYSFGRSRAAEKSAAENKANPSESKAPNILMIGCDTLRVDRLGVAGDARQLTPYIDSLAHKGKFFSRCYTPLARTAPSLTSIFTGTLPDKHGVKTNFASDEQANITLPTLAYQLRQQGYKTANISDWTGSDLKKINLGFEYQDTPDDQWNIKRLIAQGPKHMRLFFSLFSQNRLAKWFAPELYYLPGAPMNIATTGQACRWLAQQPQWAQPFLLNVFIGATHPPFSSEYPYYNHLSDPAYQGRSKFGMNKLTEPEEIIRSQQEPKEAFDLQQILDLYDGCVRCFDDQVQRMLQQLTVSGLASNTLVVIYSDHGMDFFERNTWGQGNDVFGQASAKIPLVIYDPRWSQDQIKQHARVCSSIDIMPTLLDLCGVAVPDSVQGRSLMSEHSLNQACYETGLWLTPPVSVASNHLVYPDLFTLLEVADKATGTLSIKPEYSAVIEAARDKMWLWETWALVRIALEGGYQYQLYQPLSDPGFNIDLSAAYPERVVQLQQRFNLTQPEFSPCPS